MCDQVKLEPGWKKVLIEEFSKPYMKQLKQFLISQKQQGKTIYPAGAEIFNAFNNTPLDQVKVVIIGQDPYHGPGQAHGLCFSVKPQVRTPPSLVNIYKELQADMGIPPASHGFLDSWAKQGVLLLNAVLTVEKNSPASHSKKGWETFTDKVIEVLNLEKQNLVFVLWGAYAQKKGMIIDNNKHLVLKSAHPSPFSAARGFFGCSHFSKINDFLKSEKIKPISWQLPE